MLWWADYKKYRAQAEEILKSNFSDVPQIFFEICLVNEGKTSKDKAIENIIDILSNGQHYAPLHDFKKIGNQQKLFDND